MSCLNSFYIAHFEEKNNFIQVKEKDLVPDQANFLEKGYKIDKQKFSCNHDKVASSSGKKKKKVDDLINLSNDDQDDKMQKEDDAIDLKVDRYVGRT